MKIMKNHPVARLAYLFLCGLIALPNILFAQSSSKERALEGATVSHSEVLRRQESLLLSRQLIQEAESLLAAGDYTKAANLFGEAQKLLGPAPATSAEVGRVSRGKSVALYEMANEAFKRKEFGQAAGWAVESYQLDPENRGALGLYERASAANERSEAKQGVAAKEQSPEISNPEFIAKQKKVLELYRSFENFYKSEQFDEAEEALKDILRIDPYSATAYHRLREVQLAKYRKLDEGQLQTEAERILDVKKGWLLPLRRDKVFKAEGSENDVETSGSKKDITRKLNSIVIKSVEFDKAPLRTAINFLMQESREMDTSADKTGVNIILSLPDEPAAPVAAAPSPDGSTPPIDVAAVSSTASKTVTLNLKNVPLITVLKYLTSTTGLRYTIEPEAVVVSLEGASKGKTQTRTFHVKSSAFNSTMTKNSTPAAGGGSSAGGGFQAMGAGTTTIAKTNAKQILQDMGIDFTDTKTSADYREGLGLLVVTHYTDVLDQIEQIVLQLNQLTPQVQIETKFIDVNQSDLDELGFRWAFAPTTQNEFVVESGRGTSLDQLPINGFYRGLGGSLTGGNRGANQLAQGAIDALLAGATGGIANTVLTVTGILTNPQMQFFIDALARKGLTNLLSAPRITAMSGESAQILVTREFIYPSQYSDPQVQVSGGAVAGAGVGILAPSPTAFTTREVGVILDVRPTVVENTTISLALTPEVVDFEGFIPYTTSAVAGAQQFTFTIQQPLFSKRTLKTSVIIWDGQTVMLGGLIREDVTKIDDKVPFLGDIPFLGRLFRSKVNSSTKRNLIIFLHAQIVDPSGKPIRSTDAVHMSTAPSDAQ
jgi:general secretion pathway protein D